MPEELEKKEETPEVVETTSNPEEKTDKKSIGQQIMSPPPKTRLTVLLSILAVALIGSAFYLWWQNKSTSESSTSTTTSTSSSISSSSSADVTADWKTYENTTYAVSFKYPADWVIAGTKKITFNNIDIDDVSLTSPDGFEINLIAQEGIGGVCGEEGCPFRKIIKSEELDNEGDTKFYAVQYGGNTDDSIEKGNASSSLALYLSNVNETPRTERMLGYHPIFSSPVTDEIGLEFYGYYPKKDKFNNLTAEDFFNLPDLVTAKKIFQTFKVDETLTWKTYTNDQYGFSFKYPSSWVNSSFLGEPTNQFGKESLKSTDYQASGIIVNKGQRVDILFDSTAKTETWKQEMDQMGYGFECPDKVVKDNRYDTLGSKDVWIQKVYQDPAGNNGSCSAGDGTGFGKISFRNSSNQSVDLNYYTKDYNTLSVFDKILETIDFE